ncbi:hypothetical protein GCM10010306_062280 [Streptomyces umbrinus]|uniref:hypothetical protein n=1 Tax=Streptomyces umbrinus TaxID=67370 RepID=UPI00167313A2|nr:hypothetical protein [Streptomyces umbrinus]GHB60246.1 hypothetical protein GCM10010306_062280 [Streptomyces umbrinus]
MAPPAPRPGDQLASTECTTRVVVIRAPADGPVRIECGGRPMVPADGAPPPTGTTDAGPGTVLGKRYVDAADTVEVLCTSPGAGQLTVDDAPLTIKAAKPLPASD